jgi:hypothetical protein
LWIQGPADGQVLPNIQAGEAHANCGFHTAEGLLGKNQDRHRHTDKFYVDEEKLTPATVAHVSETQTPDSKDE